MNNADISYAGQVKLIYTLMGKVKFLGRVEIL